MNDCFRRLPCGRAQREGINQVLPRIREDGRYEGLYRKWFGRSP